MRILTTGSRAHNGGRVILDALSFTFARYRTEDQVTATVINGACPHGEKVPGADWLSSRCARALGMIVEEHRADWSLGRRGGPIRNQHMVDLGANVCLAFYQPGAGNSGTQDCVRRALVAGIDVVRYPREKCPACAGLIFTTEPVLPCARCDGFGSVFVGPGWLA